MVKQSDENPENSSEDLRINKLSQAVNNLGVSTQGNQTTATVKTSENTSCTILVVDDTPKKRKLLLLPMNTLLPYLSVWE